MRVRFVANGREGVFQAAYELLRSETLDKELQGNLQFWIDWFDLNLAEPEEAAFSQKRAICRFKEESRDCISRPWSMTAILKECGVSVRLIRTFRPGYVTFEDAHQVVAIPFADTFDA